ncbi:hypothetical protein BGW39_006199 [Mortierella sp. 14UC]|nr:hypothetical protein BGW39_006199 [Mortierella sp. 14UC]
MDSYAVHPLQSAEIILRVGRFIPLWIPLYDDDGPQEFEFTPKDLLAAIAVNKQFQRILTPLLWVLFSESVFCPRAPLTLINKNTRNNNMSGTRGISIDILNRYSPHFRFLECLRDYDTATGLVTPIPCYRFTCSHLQELILSCFVEPTVASQLIRSNPNLSVLLWSYPDIAVTSTLWTQDSSASTSTGVALVAGATLDLKPLFGLHQLRSLTLEGWPINPWQLCCILENNAAHLQDLVLTERCFLDPTVRMDPSWLGPRTAKLATLTDNQTAQTAYLVSGSPLSFPKLKLLCLHIAWEKTCRSIYTLVKCFPALVALMIQPDSVLHARALSQTLREFCPRLRSVQCFDEGWIMQAKTPLPSETVVALICAATPGRLTEFKMGIDKLDKDITQALLSHKDSLEVLELVIARSTIADIKNMARLVQKCKRLKQLAIVNHDQASWDAYHGMKLFRTPWVCQETLESCMLNGFASNVFEEFSFDELSGEEDEENFEDAYRESDEDVLEDMWQEARILEAHEERRRAEKARREAERRKVAEAEARRVKELAEAEARRVTGLADARRIIEAEARRVAELAKARGTDDEDARRLVKLVEAWNLIMDEARNLAEMSEAKDATGPRPEMSEAKDVTGPRPEMSEAKNVTGPRPEKEKTVKSSTAKAPTEGVQGVKVGGGGPRRRIKNWPPKLPDGYEEEEGTDETFEEREQWIQNEEKREQQRVYLRCIMGMADEQCRTKAERDRDLEQLLEMRRTFNANSYHSGPIREGYCTNEDHRPKHRKHLRQNKYDGPPLPELPPATTSDGAVGVGTGAGGGRVDEMRQRESRAEEGKAGNNNKRVSMSKSAPAIASAPTPLRAPGPWRKPKRLLVPPVKNGVPVPMIPVRPKTPKTLAEENAESQMPVDKLQRVRQLEETIPSILDVVPEGWVVENEQFHEEYDLASTRGQVFRITLLNTVAAMPRMTSLTLNGRVYRRA